MLTLRRDRLEITKLTGNVGGGLVSASGAVLYRPTVQFNLGLKGDDLRFLYAQSVRADLGLNLAMTGNMEAAMYKGR